MQKQKKKNAAGSSKTKKQTILTVDGGIIESAVEGCLWGMRLIEHGESVTGIEDLGNGKYAISVEQTGKATDTNQISLAFMGKDNL